VRLIVVKTEAAGKLYWIVKDPDGGGCGYSKLRMYYHGPFADEATARANVTPKAVWKTSHRWDRVLRRQASPRITHRQASI
jgi:hypothetical protein